MQMTEQLQEHDITLLSLDEDIVNEVISDEKVVQLSSEGSTYSEPTMERRIERRVPVKWSGYCQRLDATKISVVTNDISLSGLGLWLAKPLKVGEKVYVSVEATAKGGTVRLSAILVIQNVVLSNDLFRCGGKFCSLSKSTRKQIFNFLHAGSFNPERSLSS